MWLDVDFQIVIRSVILSIYLNESGAYEAGKKKNPITNPTVAGSRPAGIASLRKGFGWQASCINGCMANAARRSLREGGT